MRQEKQTLRKTLVFLDFSEGIKVDDYKPTRQLVILEALSKLVDKFEQNNPLSQLGIYLLRNLKCDTFIELGTPISERSRIFQGFLASAQGDGPHNIHSTLQIKSASEHEPAGQISLYNAMKCAYKVFSDPKDYSYREIYLILSATGTNDANDIYDSVRLLGGRRVKINVISLSCENFLFKEIVRQTGGRLLVPGSKHEFEERVYNIADPIFSTENGSYLFAVAFVSLFHTKYPVYCPAHGDWICKGYRCSKCWNIHCAPAATCSLCAVRLISPIDIVRRSVNEGLREKFEEAPGGGCDLCREAGARKCLECGMRACAECFEFVFENIRFCLGCFSAQE